MSVASLYNRTKELPIFLMSLYSGQGNIISQSIYDCCFIFEGSQSIDLRMYTDQVKEYGNPISKILNDAWQELFNNPVNFPSKTE